MMAAFMALYVERPGIGFIPDNDEILSITPPSIIWGAAS
jgi:hypothetical protein